MRVTFDLLLESRFLVCPFGPRCCRSCFGHCCYCEESRLKDSGKIRRIRRTERRPVAGERGG